MNQSILSNDGLISSSVSKMLDSRCLQFLLHSRKPTRETEIILGTYKSRNLLPPCTLLKPSVIGKIP